MRRLVRILTCLAICAAAPFTVWAQAYPSKPITVLVPFPPGAGGIDLFARLIGARIGDALGQPVIVENPSGAGGTIAAGRVARAAPDGHTLLFATPGVIVTSFFLSKNLPYDPLKDFTPITAAIEPVTVLVVGAAVPARSVRELIDYARANPNKVFFGSNGIGTIFHAMGELLNLSAGTQMTHVPYKGAPPVLNDLVSGQLQMAMNSAATFLPLVRSGKLRILAVLEASRYPGLPDVPTLSETVPGFEKPATWWAYFGPGGLPAPIAARLQAEIARALAAPDIRPKLEEAALTVVANTPEQFAALYRNGFDVYARAFKAAGIKPE